jgi:hypothetical protein
VPVFVYLYVSMCTAYVHVHVCDYWESVWARVYVFVCVYMHMRVCMCVRVYVRACIRTIVPLPWYASMSSDCFPYVSPSAIGYNEKLQTSFPCVEDIT